MNTRLQIGSIGLFLLACSTSGPDPDDDAMANRGDATPDVLDIRDARFDASVDMGRVPDTGSPDAPKPTDAVDGAQVDMSPGPQTDASTDDGGTDSQLDASSDSQLDASSDSQSDVSSDSQSDVSSDSPNDGPLGPGSSIACDLTLECAPGTINCGGGRCIADSGCGCNACSLPHSSSQCSAGACAITSCYPGWADCDHNPNNGCEASLEDPTTCGSCGVACAAAEKCSASGCVSSCTPPATDCGTRCSRLGSSVFACGSCTNRCYDKDQVRSSEILNCSSGTCSTIPTCANDFSICGTHCVDLQRDSVNCGSCGNICDELCVQGRCSCGVGESLCGSACVDLEEDPANCGDCGHSCGGQACSGGACVDPTPTDVAPIAGTPGDVIIDSSYVCWTEGTTVHRANRDGSNPTTLADNQDGPGRLAVDDTYVYWSNPLGAAIMRRPKDGTGTPALVATANAPLAIAVDGTHVYWIDQTTKNVQRASKGGGGTPENVFANAAPGSDILLDDSFLYFGVYLVAPARLNKTNFSQILYLGDQTGGTAHLAADCRRIYIADQTGKTAAAYSVRTDGSDQQFESTLGIPGSRSIRVDDRYLYENHGLTGIGRMLKHGSRLLRNLIPINSVASTYFAVDGQFVYWFTSTKLQRRPR